MEDQIMYQSDYADFYKIGKKQILSALDGKKLRHKHIRKGFDLLKKNFHANNHELVPVVAEAIQETVAHDQNSGYEGNEVNYFSFAKKLRIKAAATLAKKLPAKLKKGKMFSKLQSIAKNIEKNPAPLGPMANVSSSAATSPPSASTAPISGGGGGSGSSMGESEEQEASQENSAPLEVPAAAAEVKKGMSSKMLIGVVLILVACAGVAFYLTKRGKAV